MMDVEGAVRARYSAGAQAREDALCCPVDYDPSLLEAIPQAVLDRDYGCGDPTRHLRAGETVLDLGSGSGKHCFMAAQVVGAGGRVIGVDINDDMLALARDSAPEFARRVGFDVVSFRKARIQDLATDREAVDRWLREHPVTTEVDLRALEAELTRLRADAPLIADDSVDAVISNCVLNLVSPADKQRLLPEIFRVLRPGGRAVISDITSDEDVPERLQRDPELWSGCISGALREDRFLAAFEAAGFGAIEIVDRGAEPWRTVDGIEFRSVTVIARKLPAGACYDRNQAVIYRGPFRQVEDDDGHVIRRGVRTAVCEKTFRTLSAPPYRDHFDHIEPRVPVALDDAPLMAMACAPSPAAPSTLAGGFGGLGAVAPGLASSAAPVRDPRQQKGADYRDTTDAAPAACGPGSGCC